MNNRAKNILVVGGAGYIGSHMVKILDREGISVTTVDSLVHGYRETVTCGEFIRGDLADRDFLARLFNEQRFDCVIHFASFIQVGESMVDPALYYRSNLINTQNLLGAMVESDHLNLIFSSSAAIYGEPEELPIDENHPKKPLNPYGKSKLMTEEILADFDRADGMKSACLRYFNAAGADPEGELGERHQTESHLIPLVLRAASGRMEEITVNGRDHETPDGTCLRDYIHVNDLCRAHILAMKKLRQEGKSLAFNLGNGRGFSIAEVIETAEKVTGREIRIKEGPRRPGDCAVLVADSTLAEKELGWRPEFGDLATIISHAGNLRKRWPGYEAQQLRHPRKKGLRGPGGKHKEPIHRP